MAMAELCAVACLLQGPPQPQHSELRGCWGTCCPIRATEMRVTNKLSDLILLRYMLQASAAARQGPEEVKARTHPNLLQPSQN